MIKPVVTFSEVENVGFIYQNLTRCSHNGFPVINADNELTGLILRH